MAQQADASLPGARLVVFASAELTDGFSLIGAEVHPDADPDRVEEVLAQLVKDGSAALVLLESRLSRPAGPWLSRLRDEGAGDLRGRDDPGDGSGQGGHHMLLHPRQSPVRARPANHGIGSTGTAPCLSSI